METKISTLMGILIICAIILPTVWFCYREWLGLVDATEKHYYQTFVSSSDISNAEKSQIDKWIIKNHLNQYGDFQNTVYLGGTPLFNEETGETITKYEYIIKKHPDRPWKKL